jgi:hypothetical protein
MPCDEDTKGRRVGSSSRMPCDGWGAYQGLEGASHPFGEQEEGPKEHGSDTTLPYWNYGYFSRGGTCALQGGGAQEVFSGMGRMAGVGAYRKVVWRSGELQEVNWVGGGVLPGKKGRGPRASPEADMKKKG